MISWRYCLGVNDGEWLLGQRTDACAAFTTVRRRDRYFILRLHKARGQGENFMHAHTYQEQTSWRIRLRFTIILGHSHEHKTIYSLPNYSPEPGSTFDQSLEYAYDVEISLESARSRYKVWSMERAVATIACIAYGN
jgi:hypothetical protein